MSEHAPEIQSPLEVFRLDGGEVGTLLAAVNQTVADEARLEQRLAIVRGGESLTERLSIAPRRGWFEPFLGDMLRQGVSVVINDVALTDAVAGTVARHTGLPEEWVTQQNLYVTPKERQGFDPHCDPHIVVVAHLFGGKEWTIYEKSQDNPVYAAESNTVAGAGEDLPVRARVTVTAGDCFVIPRGVYHSALALTPASVHAAIGVAGARALDYIWALAEAAVGESALRADAGPEAALRAARDFMAAHPLSPIPLPRFPRTEAGPPAAALSFQGVLDALSGD